MLYIANKFILTPYDLYYCLNVLAVVVYSSMLNIALRSMFLFYTELFYLEVYKFLSHAKLMLSHGQ